MVLRSLALLAGAVLVLSQAGASATCVSPPDVTSVDYALQWGDVIQATPLPKAAGVIRAQTLDKDGFGVIHLDYDAITLDAKMAPERFFELIRSNLGSLLVKPELKRRLFAFSPVGPQGTAAWSSNDQTGALLRFTVSQFAGSLSFENDDFLVSCSDAESLTLTSVTTETGGLNALSGTRGVGVIINANGSLTLFTKAAQRLATSPLQVLGESQGQEIFAGNSTIWLSLIDRVGQLIPGTVLRDHAPISRVQYDARRGAVGIEDAFGVDDPAF